MNNEPQQLPLPPMTLGMKLAQSRESAGMSQEEAANFLRMRVSLVRGMENDDLIGFSHPSYARLSLMDYARLLHIPIEEIRGWLPDIGCPSIEDCRYLDHFSDPLPAARRQDMIEERKLRHPFVPLIRILLLVLLVAILAYGWLLLRNLGRLGRGAGEGQAQAVEKIVDQREAAPPPVKPAASDSSPAQRDGEAAPDDSGPAEVPVSEEESEAQASPAPLESPAPQPTSIPRVRRATLP